MQRKVNNMMYCDMEKTKLRINMIKLDNNYVNKGFTKPL